MEIEHKLHGTQVEYGYIWWKTKEENDRYKQVFPAGEFTIDLQGRKLTGKKVDWKLGRVSIGKKPMQELFKKDNVILISKLPSGIVVVRKKSVGFEPKQYESIEDLPLITKLRNSQRNSNNSVIFEKVLVEAFNALGFSARHIGGRDEPDILIEDYKILFDAKTTEKGIISEAYVNFNALERYKNKHNIKYIGIVAPGFSSGNIQTTAEKEGITLIETEVICKILQNHIIYPYDTSKIVDILFKSNKCILTPNDVSPSIIDQQKLIEIVTKVISDIKSIRKTSFSIQELHIAYSWQGLNYEVDDIDNALKFLSTTPFNILEKRDEMYVVTGNIESIFKKIGILLHAFSKTQHLE